MEPKTQTFFNTVLDILAQDYTQTCNEAEGTKIQILGDKITIIGGISCHTLRQLVATGYLVSADDSGKVQVDGTFIGGN